MATKHMYQPIGVKAPASIEEFYKRYLKNRMSELRTDDIPLELLVEVNQFQRKYKMIKINVRKEDVDVINRVANAYGVSKGTALLMIVFYNFSEAKNFLKSYILN
jgi:hypothetical protein